MNNLWKRLVGFAVVAVLVSVGGGGCQVRPESAGEESSIARGETDSYTVRNKEQVLARVAEMGGVPQDLLQESTVNLVTLEEDNTPFLSEQIIGRTLWQVTIPKWKLQLPSAIPGVEDTYERTFDVLVDPATGNTLKIESRWPQDVEGMPPEVSADRAEVQMVNSERYHGFSQDKPAITFLEALDIVRHEGGGNPLVAKQILAHYVEQSWMGGQPRPVWAITLRGIHIERLAPAPLEESTQSARGMHVVRQMRHIVDARTGQWLLAINIPNPFLEPADPGESLQAFGEPGPDSFDLPTVTLDLSSSSDGTTVAPAQSIDWTITATVSVGDNFGLALVTVDLVQDLLNPELFDIPPGLPAAGMED